jgi:DNA-damage-inducible protein J
MTACTTNEQRLFKVAVAERNGRNMSKQNTPDVTNAARTSSFQMRMNPEIKRKAETVFAKCGLTLTDAVNIFIQQSLNAGGLPFLVSEENAEYLKAKAMKQLLSEVEKGWQSVKAEDDWITEDEMYSRLGVEK